MGILFLATILTSFTLTYLTIPSIVNVSNAKKLFDVPNGRKLNKVVVPTLGGIAIFIGLSISSILFLQKDSGQELRYLLAAVIMMFFLGIKDDILVMSAKKKLIVQLIAALILVLLGNFRVTHAYGMFSASVFNDWFSIPVSVLIILFLINAINLIDGIDGLAAGLSLMVSLVLGTWFFLSGHVNYAILCLALSGSLIAFLRYNLYGGKNKIFMGDTGSLTLGVFLAVISISFNEMNFTAAAPYHFSQAPLLALSLMIVPVTDTLRVFAIRIKNKRSPFSPDMNHFHHLLIKLGLTHIQATCFMLAYTASFTMLALLFSHFELELTTGFVLLLVLSFSAVALIDERAKYQVKSSIAADHKKHQVKIIILNTRKNEPAANGTPHIAVHETAIPVREKNFI